MADPREQLRIDLDEDLEAMGYAGLYEALWTLNGYRLELTEAQKRAIAREVVDELMAEGKLELRRLTWPNARFVSDPLPLSILDDPASWDVESEPGYVAMVERGYNPEH